MNFNFDIDVELTVKVESYRPARPAPACSNPSDPRYSDPGDDAEFEDFRVYLMGNDITDFLPVDILGYIEDRIYYEGCKVAKEY